MSDKGDNGSQGGSGPQFTERELELLGFAMRSLKSGPPEIDYEKLANFAGMSNPRSASNAWAKIRTKLMASGDDINGTASPKPAAKGTPKKKSAVASKTKAKDESANDDADANGDTPATLKKTPRKRAAKKQEADGEASPKKKGRGASKVKESSDEAAIETTTEAKTGVEIEDGSDGQDAKPDSEATATAEDGKDEKVDEV